MKDYDTTLARVAGNILSGLIRGVVPVYTLDAVESDALSAEEVAAVQRSVELAELVIEECRLSKEIQDEKAAEDARREAGAR